MTPERKVEIDIQIAWWRKCENWRINGFDIVNNDPMYVAMDKRHATLTSWTNDIRTRGDVNLPRMDV